MEKIFSTKIVFDCENICFEGQFFSNQNGFGLKKKTNWIRKTFICWWLCFLNKEFFFEWKNEEIFVIKICLLEGEFGLDQQSWLWHVEVAKEEIVWKDLSSL